MAINGFGKANMKDIRKLEQKYNVKLPNDYVEFLLKYNGGDIALDDNNKIYVRYLQDYIHVDILLGVATENKELDIEFWTDQYLDDMQEGMLIIGHSYEHGFIILNCYPNEQCISYWDDTYEFECSNDDTNNYFVTETFIDFIKNLL